LTVTIEGVPWGFIAEEPAEFTPKMVAARVTATLARTAKVLRIRR
jgi:hypothetical protein